MAAQVPADDPEVLDERRERRRRRGARMPEVSRRGVRSQNAARRADAVSDRDGIAIGIRVSRFSNHSARVVAEIESSRSEENSVVMNVAKGVFEVKIVP